MTETSANFAFTKLVVADLQQAAAFYRAVCGYGEGQTITGTIAGRPIEEIIFSRSGGGAELILLTYPEGPAPSPTGVITGLSTPDQDAFQARVLAAGGTILEDVRSPTFGTLDMRVGFFTDPQGYVLEVMER